MAKKKESKVAAPKPMTELEKTQEALSKMCGLIPRLAVDDDQALLEFRAISVERQMRLTTAKELSWSKYACEGIVRATNAALQGEYETSDFWVVDCLKGLKKAR